MDKNQLLKVKALTLSAKDGNRIFRSGDVIVASDLEHPDKDLENGFVTLEEMPEDRGADAENIAQEEEEKSEPEKPKKTRGGKGKK